MSLSLGCSDLFDMFSVDAKLEKAPEIIKDENGNSTTITITSGKIPDANALPNSSGGYSTTEKLVSLTDFARTMKIVNSSD
jgi:hypothetical protein